MSNKELKLKGRVQNKHKTEAEWYLDVYKATGSTELRDDPFIPLDGELIIYDPDSVHTGRRIKIGDNVHNVVALPFYEEGFATETYVDDKVAELDAEDVGALPLTGGVMTGEIQIGQGDGKGIQLGTNGRINATVGTNKNATMFGISNGNYYLGHSGFKTLMRGSAERPSYNGKDLALSEDMSKLQSKTDENLATGKKTIVEAINELNGKISDAIIDVIKLPDENINEKSFYRILKAQFVCNRTIQEGWYCYVVEGLPESAMPVTNEDFSLIHMYANTQDGIVSGYIDETLSQFLGMPVGWYTVSDLLNAVGVTYDGVISHISDDPCDDAYRILVKHVIYSYKDGRWTSNEVDTSNLATVDKITKVNINCDANNNVNYDETNGTTWDTWVEIATENGEGAFAEFSGRVPIVAGKNVEFEVDAENQVVKISADIGTKIQADSFDNLNNCTVYFNDIINNSNSYGGACAFETNGILCSAFEIGPNTIWYYPQGGGSSVQVYNNGWIDEAWRTIKILSITEKTFINFIQEHGKIVEIDLQKYLDEQKYSNLNYWLADNGESYGVYISGYEEPIIRSEYNGLPVTEFR